MRHRAITATGGSASSSNPAARWSTSVILAAAVLVAAGLTPAVASSGSVESSGDCTEAGVSVPVERQDVEPYLPGGAKLKGDTLGIFAEQCSIALEGHSARPTKLGGVIIDLEAPLCPSARNGDSNTESYAFFWTTDRGGLSGGWSSIGFFHGLVPDQTFNLDRKNGVDRVDASVPFGYSPYSLSVEAPTPVMDFAPSAPFRSRHWQLGSKGGVRGTFDHKPFKVSFGTGKVHVTPGTPLYHMLGDREQAAGVGLIADFSYSGPFDLVNCG